MARQTLDFDLGDIFAFSLVSGATGSGKSYFIAKIIEYLLERGITRWGVCDPKPEIFNLALYLVHKYGYLDKLRIIDFSNSGYISPYNILCPWPGCDADYFIHTRSETLRELMPGKDSISLRAAGLLKHCIALLAEQNYPITRLEELLENVVFRTELTRKSKLHATKYFFAKIFPKEPPQTIASLRGRMGALLSSSGLRNSLAQRGAPDFRQLQDDGRIVLINYGGPEISRGTRMLLQGLLISDIRQSVFTRQNQNPYIWWVDEAQTIFNQTQASEDLQEILNGGRSFGTFLSLICHNLNVQAQSTELRELLRTHLAWSMSFRSTPESAAFLKSAFPITTRIPKSTGPFQEPQYMTENEERNHLLEGVASLRNREGWLWQRTKSRTAQLVKTAELNLGSSGEVRGVLNAIKNSTIGGRIERVEAPVSFPVSGIEVFLKAVEADKKNETRSSGGDTLPSVRRKRKPRG